MSAAASFRVEKDLLGTLEVPADAYYGIQTLRAVQNFRLSGVPLSHYPKLVVALAMVKQAAADANKQLGHLPADKHAAITEACARLIRGEYHEQFVVDMIQGGAGTSTNMNANEVIANIGLEAMGKQKGEYKHLHPNNDVNMAQSTNDAYPTAIRLGLLLGHDALLASLDSLIQAIAAKGEEFAHVLKMGRTQLQDAVPMTLGQEFHAFATTLGEDLDRLRRLAPELLTEVNLGGTAIGTGINADPRFGAQVAKALKQQTGFKFDSAENKFEGLAAQDDAVELSGQLNALAVALIKIANDLRWMNAGPLAGLGEIELPALQPGSSIMPGKVNPVIPEATVMACAQVIGHHTAITVAGQTGNFQLNVTLPLIAVNLLDGIGLLANVSTLLADSAIAGLKVREDRVAEALARNPILVTALNPIIGYEKAAAIAKRAYKEQRPVLDVALEDSGLEEA